MSDPNVSRTGSGPNLLHRLSMLVAGSILALGLGACGLIPEINIPVDDPLALDGVKLEASSIDNWLSDVEPATLFIPPGGLSGPDRQLLDIVKQAMSVPRVDYGEPNEQQLADMMQEINHQIALDPRNFFNPALDLDELGRKKFPEMPSELQDRIEQREQQMQELRSRIEDRNRQNRDDPRRQRQEPPIGRGFYPQTATRLSLEVEAGKIPAIPINFRQEIRLAQITVDNAGDLETIEIHGYAANSLIFASGANPRESLAIKRNGTFDEPLKFERGSDGVFRPVDPDAMLFEFRLSNEETRALLSHLESGKDVFATLDFAFIMSQLPEGSAIDFTLAAGDAVISNK